MFRNALVVLQIQQPIHVSLIVLKLAQLYTMPIHQPESVRLHVPILLLFALSKIFKTKFVFRNVSLDYSWILLRVPAKLHAHRITMLTILRGYVLVFVQ